jgi:hypothetical protein
VLVSIPAQAASKDRQQMTTRVRSALKKKKGDDVVMKKMAAIGEAARLAALMHMKKQRTR